MRNVWELKILFGFSGLLHYMATLCHNELKRVWAKELKLQLWLKLAMQAAADNLELFHNFPPILYLWFMKYGYWTNFFLTAGLDFGVCKAVKLYLFCSNPKMINACLFSGIWRCTLENRRKSEKSHSVLESCSSEWVGIIVQGHSSLADREDIFLSLRIFRVRCIC